MRAFFGLLIVVGCLLIGVFAITNYLLPDVICKNIPPPASIGSKPGEYDSQLLSDICSGLT